MDKNFLKELLKPENKNTLRSIYMLFIIGVILLVLSGSLSKSSEMVDEDVYESNSEYLKENASVNYIDNNIEKQLEETLSKVEGAGEVDVFITYSSTEERIIAKNIKTEINYNELGKDVIEKEENDVVLVSGDTPYILMEYSPKVEGVVVVAGGGDNPIVKQALHSSVQAVFDVEAHKIVILKMK